MPSAVAAAAAAMHYSAGDDSALLACLYAHRLTPLVQVSPPGVRLALEYIRGLLSRDDAHEFHIERWREMPDWSTISQALPMLLCIDRRAMTGAAGNLLKMKRFDSRRMMGFAAAEVSNTFCLSTGHLRTAFTYGTQRYFD